MLQCLKRATPLELSIQALAIDLNSRRILTPSVCNRKQWRKVLIGLPG
jgi:hypothetical protein